MGLAIIVLIVFFIIIISCGCKMKKNKKNMKNKQPISSNKGLFFFCFYIFFTKSKMFLKVVEYLQIFQMSG